MKATLLIIAIPLLVQNQLHAQAGYEYNGATGKYEYNSDPFGGLAERYQNYTQMQTGTLQRMNNNLQQLNQAAGTGNSTASMLADINSATAAGKKRIADGKASNLFNWKYGNQFSETAKKQADMWKGLMGKNNLRTNHYADVKAFLVLTYFMVANGIEGDNVAAKKAEAKKLDKIYLSNEYIQGMNDEQRTANIMSDFDNLAKIGAQGVHTVQAKQMAAHILESMGYGKAEQLTITSNGLENKGKLAIENKQVRTSFKRIPGSIFIDKLKQSGKATPENIKKSTEYLTVFDNLVKKINGPDNDHAFAQALIFNIYYMMYNEGKPLTSAQQESVIKLFYDDLVKDAGFQAATDAQLQQFYEQNAIECMAIAELYAAALKNKKEFDSKLNDPKIDPSEKLSMSASTKVYDEMNTAKNRVYEMLKKYFQPRNFDDYTLTKNGFEKKH